MSSTTSHNGRRGERALRRCMTGMLVLAVTAGFLTAFPIPPEPGGKTFRIMDTPPSIKDKVYGLVTEVLTGTPVDGVLVNITSNETGFLWSNYTGMSDGGIHGTYNAGQTLPAISGELVTVEIGDESTSGFRGSANAIASNVTYTRIDLVVEDIAPPKITEVFLPAWVLAGGNVNLSAEVSDNFRVNTVYARITSPNQTQKLVFLSDPENDTIYSGRFNETQWGGNYSVIFSANDSTGNGKTAGGTFNVNATAGQTNWLKTLSAGWSLISIPVVT